MLAGRVAEAANLVTLSEPPQPGAAARTETTAATTSPRRVWSITGRRIHRRSIAPTKQRTLKGSFRSPAGEHRRAKPVVAHAILSKGPLEAFDVGRERSPALPGVARGTGVCERQRATPREIKRRRSRRPVRVGRNPAYRPVSATPRWAARARAAPRRALRSRAAPATRPAAR